MKNRTLSALLVCVLTIPVGNRIVAQDANSENAGEKTASKADRFIVFQVPDASCAAGGFPSCTIPVGINAEETVVGYYFDSIDATHGFLRLVDGTITTFDVPGSVCIDFSSNCAMPTSINSAGAVVGSYSDGTATHGFLRDRYGDYTKLDPPGSAFTQPNAINRHGEIAGLYCNTTACHGFVRDRHGKFTTIDYPGAVNGTVPLSINKRGDIVGLWYDASDASHIFLRDRDGTLVGLDPPGSIYVFQVVIDDGGELVGYYADSTSLHGFIRHRDGDYTTFSGNAVGIDRSGTVAGWVGNLSGFGSEGFYRLRDGIIRTFLPPNAVVTTVTGISPHGEIIGWFTDPTFVTHAFIRESDRNSRTDEREEED